MAYFAKFEKFKVVERRNGEVYKTKKVGEQWFESKDFPEPYIVDDQDELWVVTNDYHFGKEKPNA